MSDEKVVSDAEFVFLANSRIGTADLLADDGATVAGYSWEVTTTPQPRGVESKRIVVCTAAQLAVIRDQIDYVLNA